MTLLDDMTSQPSVDPEALIEEARDAQRRRYRRGGGAFALLAALIAGGLLIFGGGGDPPAPNGPAPGVIHASLPAGITARAPDPGGKWPWALRLVRTDGYTCVQLGRLSGDQLGMVGIDRMFHDDGLFHRFAVSASYHAICAQSDGDGHAFMTMEAGSLPASGAISGYTPQSGCDPASEVAAARNSPIRKKIPNARFSNPGACPASDLRFIQYGLLGPDATSITYTYDKHVITERTSGPDGAYLVVGPATTAFCNQLSKYSFCGSNGYAPSAIFRAMVLKVRYRNGSTCTAGSATAGQARTPLGLECPAEGYVTPKAKPNQYGAPSPVTAHVIKAKHYCFTNSAISQKLPAPATDLGPYIPCDGAVPTGEIRATGPSSQGNDIVFSWTARKASTSTALYRYTIMRDGPNAQGCGSGDGGQINGRVSAGEHLTRADFEPSACTGTFTGTIYYYPNVGPQADSPGPLSGLAGQGGNPDDAVTIGHFRVAIN